MERGESTRTVGELNRGFTFPRTSPALGTIHHRSRSSRARFASEGPGGQPGAVGGPKLSRSTTLQSLKER